MSFWKSFFGIEERASYTEAIVDSLLLAAHNTTADVSTTAALETAAGAIARAFSSAVVSPEKHKGLLNSHFLNLTARSMVIAGEMVWDIRVESGMLRLYPCQHWEVTGSNGPETWRYELEIASPDGVSKVIRPARSVLHFRYAVDPRQPWQGISPMGQASQSARLAANLEKALADEAGGTTGQLVPAPIQGEEGANSAIAKLASDLKGLQGKTAIVPSWDPREARPTAADWTIKRLGANPPPSINEIRESVTKSVLAACGVPTELVFSGSQTAQREGWRRFLHGTIVPLGDTITDELSDKLEDDITLNYDRLFASDLSGRARAFGSMVNGGMPLDKAAALSGLLTEE